MQRGVIAKMFNIKELRYAKNLKEAIECINDKAIRNEFEYFYDMLVSNFQRQIEDNEERFDSEYEQLELDNNRLIEENDELILIANKLYEGIIEIDELTNRLKKVK